MTNQQTLQERYSSYRKFEKGTIKPYLEELWYLRVPAFTAILSLIFFAGIDQTLEVYRVLALNASFSLERIVFSFAFIFLLSLSIWHSSRALSRKRVEELGLEEKYKNLPTKQYDNSFAGKVNFIREIINSIFITLISIFSVLFWIFRDLFFRESNLRNATKKEVISSEELRSRFEALLWLPRIFGFLPLLALGSGLYRTVWSEGFGIPLFVSGVVSGVESLSTGFLGFIFLILTVIFAVFFWSRFRRFWILMLISFSIGILLFSHNVIKNEQGTCVWRISNQPTDWCQISSLLHLYFGLAITVSLSIVYFDFVNNRKKRATDNKAGISRRNLSRDEQSSMHRIQRIWGVFLSLFKLRAGDSTLFSPSFLGSLSFLLILVFSIFTFPLITNELARCIAIIFILLLLYQILKLVCQSNKILVSCLLSLSFVALLLVAFVLPPLASHLGSLIIIALFLIMFSTLSSTIFYVGYKTKISFIAILLVSAFALSLFNLNDNHRLRELSETPKSLLTLEAEFKEWMKPRKNEISAFASKAENSEYPIYLVSAQGGGIFAAYHAASTLSRLQDLCPAFAHHVFAISGVSGGSLGATAFSSLVKALQPKSTQNCLGKVSPLNGRGPLETKAHQLLNQDLLSPLLAAGLFPDFIQRFLPFLPFFSETIDRARGLEYAFEQGWNSVEWNDQKEHPNLLRNSYYDHWSPESAAPALVLNTTVVETGERLLFSPFTFKTPALSHSKFPVLADISTVACKNKNESPMDFPLSTAAVLSARFPFVTPVGWFNRCNDKYGDSIASNPNPKSRLADGGYFENSGFSTAFEIGQRLERFLQDGDYPKNIKVVYLALTNNPPLKQEAGGLNELMSPMNALFNSREARGRSIIEQAEYKIDGRLTDDKRQNISNHRFRQFYLTHFAPSKDKTVNVCRLGSNPKVGSKPKDCQSTGGTSNFQLPLGWYLSTFSQEYIRDRVGNPDACLTDNSGDLTANINHCIMKSVIDELSEPVDSSSN